MNKRFSNQYKAVLSHAQELAKFADQSEIKATHLLDALTQVKGSIAFELMHKLGLVKSDLASADIDKFLSDSKDFVDLQFSEEVKKIIQHSVLIAAKHDHLYVSTEHLLQGLMEEHQPLVKAFLSAKQYSYDDLYGQLKAVMKNTSKFGEITASFSETDRESEKAAKTKSKRKSKAGGKVDSLLDFFAIEMTHPDFQGNLKPVIGRDKEIERIVQILARLDKNNPVLLGEPGVGKTAIIEGLSQRIVKEQVPDVLLGKKIYNLDLSLMVAGAMYRGEFESRLKQLLEEVREDDNIIIFVDEIHNIVGAGNAGGAMDAANILKPALARGEIRLIGATTFAEYKKHIEPDAALERRLQSVMVAEPSVSETIDILKGIRETYEQHHGVRVLNEALHAAAELSHRYQPDKFLPDKAIDLVDEAAAKLKVAQGPRQENRAQRELEQRLQKIYESKAQAVEAENFPEALALKEEERDLVNRLEGSEFDARGKTVLRGKISALNIAELISQITKIPTGDLVASEVKQLQNLEKNLSKRIVGQVKAVSSLAQAIKRSKTGLAHPDRPLGSFMFLGPSGVGKTETAKAVAEEVFGDIKSLIRFDMSEFAEGFNISRLIGSPAGYVGYREGGQLTESVRRNPYSVILFDEIEKAHPEIFNILLQILDEGHLTDASGKKVDFKNTVIILTSNIGLAKFNKGAEIGFAASTDQEKTQAAEEEYKHIKTSVMNSLKRSFRPEFLNRLDQIIVFEPLKLADIKKIVALEISKLVQQAKSNKLSLKTDSKLIKLIAEKSFTPQEGARAIRRKLQDLVMSPLADKILSGEVEKSKAVSITASKGEVVFK